MDITAHCPLAPVLAARLRDARLELTGRWLERIVDRVALTPDRVFPTDDLLDHMPLLIDGIADYVEEPSQPVAAEASVIAKAMELGALRHAQGFEEHEILKEYEIFGGILFNFLARTIDQVDQPCTRGEVLVCAHRVFHAVAVVQQATMTNYLQLMKARLREREERLRAFNRALTHEFRNRMGAAMGAGRILDMPDVGDAQRTRLAEIVVRNLDAMRTVLDNLLELSQVNRDTRQQRHVRLPDVMAESIRQLREMARARGVEVRIGPEIPNVEVSAAATELCLTNLVSNAIKYARSDTTDRWVEVTGYVTVEREDGPREVVIAVRNNGRGVPESQREKLFERFFRADDTEMTGTDGSGLGLSIVRETAQSVGGRAWAEFPEVGSVFCFALPCRRAHDAALLESQPS